MLFLFIACHAMLIGFDEQMIDQGAAIGQPLQEGWEESTQIDSPFVAGSQVSTDADGIITELYREWQGDARAFHSFQIDMQYRTTGCSLLPLSTDTNGAWSCGRYHVAYEVAPLSGDRVFAWRLITLKE